MEEPLSAPSCALPVGLQTNVQQMKAKLHLPSPGYCPGSTSLLSAVRSTAQATHAGRKHLVQLSTEPVSWDRCQGHHAARGSSAAYLPISLILNWGWWEGKQCRRPEEDFFFPPELLKKAGLLEYKKRYDIKEKREFWLLFQNFFLSFHTDLLRQPPSGISGNLE